MCRLMCRRGGGCILCMGPKTAAGDGHLPSCTCHLAHPIENGNLSDCCCFTASCSSTVLLVALPCLHTKRGGKEQTLRSSTEQPQQKKMEKEETKIKNTSICTVDCKRARAGWQRRLSGLRRRSTEHMLQTNAPEIAADCCSTAGQPLSDQPALFLQLQVCTIANAASERAAENDSYNALPEKLTPNSGLVSGRTRARPPPTPTGGWGGF